MHAQELRTDEHSVYEGIVPEGRHRLCLTHLRKSKGKRAFDGTAARAEEAVLEAQTMEELSRLVRRYINAHRGLPWKVNQLLQHVERTWQKVSSDPVDPTNNATERVIGLTFNIRAKTMRGLEVDGQSAHPPAPVLLPTWARRGA